MWTRLMRGLDTQRKRLVQLFILSLVLLVGGYDSSIQLTDPQLPQPAPRAGAQAVPFAPFLDIVPSDDGADLYIRARGVSGAAGDLVANVTEGPTRHRGSYTMTYSDTAQVYVATAVGFTPAQDTSGTVSITTTLGLATPAVEFERVYVPASTSQTVRSSDGNLELSLLTPGTLQFDTYIAVVPSYAPPGSAPAGNHFVGNAYSARASGARLVSDKPMSLRLYYTDAALGQFDAHSLAIFAWDAGAGSWVKLGGELFADRRYLSTITSRFTTYALMATTTWRDTFSDLTGLDEARTRNVTLGLSNDQIALVLDATPGSGEAISQPVATTSLGGWGSFAYTATRPSDTTLAFDVLSEDGTVLLSDVADDASLGAIDAARYPRLRLRARLTSSVAGISPGLSNWQVTWREVAYRVALPHLAVDTSLARP